MSSDPFDSLKKPICSPIGFEFMPFLVTYNTEGDPMQLDRH